MATVLRMDVDIVVTECGVAELRGASEQERCAALLVALAHPDRVVGYQVAQRPTLTAMTDVATTCATRKTMAEAALSRSRSTATLQLAPP